MGLTEESGRSHAFARPTPASNVAAIILAAGQGTRFQAGPGASKIIAELDGEPLARRVARNALESRARPPLVVVLGHADAAVAAALTGLPVELVRNGAHASGLASSLREGLAALPGDVSGALVLLADMPLVTRATMDGLIACFEPDCERLDAVVPTFEGRGGNPVLVGRRLFADLARLRGDAGARTLLGRPGRNVAFHPVEDPGIEIDVDTRATLSALETRGDRG